MGIVKVSVHEDSRCFTVDWNGKISSGVMPEDPDEGEPIVVVGDISILQAATFAWNGEPYFEMTEEEFAKNSGGYWSPNT